MKIKLPLVSPVFDDKRITEDLKKEFDKGCNIYVFKDPSDWEDNEETHAFSVWIEYGIDKENAIMFEVDLDDLEMFANAITKSVKMLRRDYSEVIKNKINSGALL